MFRVIIYSVRYIMYIEYNVFKYFTLKFVIHSSNNVGMPFSASESICGGIATGGKRLRLRLTYGIEDIRDCDNRTN